MLGRSVCRAIRFASADKSHLAGITPKLHENRESSLDLGGKLAVSKMTLMEIITQYINKFVLVHCF